MTTFDELQLLEQLAVDVLGVSPSVATRITHSQGGVTPQDLGASSLDIDILATSLERGPWTQGTATVQVAIEVAVVQTNGGMILAKWIMDEAWRRLGADLEFSKAFSRIASFNVSQLSSDYTGPRTRVLLAIGMAEVQHNPTFGQAVGIATEAQGDQHSPEFGDLTGGTRASTAAKLITWIDLGTILGPVSPSLLYAGAEAGDEILVKDSAGVVVETIPVTVFPSGQVAAASLSAGVYSLELAGVSAAHKLTITERPL